MTQKIKVLVAPLDWGLGHATRCLPIINELIKQGCEVWLAGYGSSGALLRERFPHLPYIPIDGYNIIYQNANKKLSYGIGLQALKIRNAIQREHKLLAALIEKNLFDAVISDNRFGMYSRKLYNVFITHQLHIYSGISTVVDALVKRINYKYINRFNECWVPDYEGDKNLAGKLSHPVKLPANTRYIGALSRFTATSSEKKYDVAFILSGPEPLRTQWEEKILTDLQAFNGSALLVRGLPLERQAPESFASVTIANHLPSEVLANAMQQSEWIICRSGYTSVMDLVALKKKAILVPTPGQAEQEYLATYLQEQKYFFTVSEEAFCLAPVLQQAAQFKFEPAPAYDDTLLESRVNQLIHTLQERRLTL